MKPFHKTHREARRYPPQQSRGSTHFIVMMAFIFMMFAPIVIKLLLSAPLAQTMHAQLPKELGLSTIALLCALPLLQQVHRYKQEDDHKKFRLGLLAVNIAGWLFLILQFIGWRKVFAMPESPVLTLSGALIILHSFHFLVAASLLLYASMQTARINTSSDLYIHFLNPEKEKFFEGSCRFWSYLTFLWAGLYAVMLLK
jgi:hypothetical protein